MATPGLNRGELEALLSEGRLSEAAAIARGLLSDRLYSADRCALLRIAGAAAFDSGDVIESLSMLREAAALADPISEQPDRFEVALALFSRESQFQNMATTLHGISQVRQLAAGLGSASALGGLHLVVSRLEAMRGLYGNARRHLLLSRHLLASVGDAAMSALEMVGSALECHSGNLSGALSGAASGVAAATRAGRQVLLASNLVNLGSVLMFRGQKHQAREALTRSRALSEDLAFVRFLVVDARAQFAILDDESRDCERLLSECAELIQSHRVPTRSWYDLAHVVTRCSLAETQGNWSLVVESVVGVEDELQRRRYNALRTTLLAAKARALAALGEHEQADRALAKAVACSPRAAVDPLIVLEATRAACATWRGDRATGRDRFERALAGCRAIGHRYHEHWISTLRDRLDSRTTVATSATPASAPAARETPAARLIGDIATILGAGHAVDLMAHHAASLLSHTTLATAVQVSATGGHEFQPLPSVTVEEHDHTRELHLHGSDRRVAIRVDHVESLDQIILVKDVADILRVAVAHAADTESEQEGGHTNLWPSTPVTEEADTIFRSPRMVEVLRVAARLADTEIPILIAGETGSGKEVVARFIHAHSRNRRGPFVPFNSAAVARDLVESQLFGHRRGAFTGAHESSPGVIRAAEGGTLFLDEVGDLDAAVQPKLLRFLEQGEIHPVGESRPHAVQVRLVAATHVDLDQASREGRFRRDLFFRLGGACIALPPLRDRKDEIPAMAALFLTRASRECGRSGLRLSDDFVAALLLHDWPGNIRELFNEIRRAVALAEDGTTLTARDLAPPIARLWRERPAAGPVEPAVPSVTVRLDQPLAQALRSVEEHFIEHALTATGGRVSEAAQLLGLSRKGLFLKRRRRDAVADRSQAI